MLTSSYNISANFKDLVIYSHPDGDDINSAHREYVTGQIKISFLLKHSQQRVIKKFRGQKYIKNTLNLRVTIYIKTIDSRNII